MRAFDPEVLLVSAGFDAHKDDPLGGLAYTEEGYAALARELVAIADTYAQGRIIFVLEGGYNTEAVAKSVVRIIETLAARPAGAAASRPAAAGWRP